MNVTEPIINAALLGTAAKEFIPNGLPETLEENFRLLQEKSEDAEDAFYQFSALTFAYSRAGMEPLPTGSTPSKFIQTFLHFYIYTTLPGRLIKTAYEVTCLINLLNCIKSMILEAQGKKWDESPKQIQPYIVTASS